MKYGRPALTERMPKIAQTGWLGSFGFQFALGVIGAWLVLRDAERRIDPTEEYDQIAVLVCVAVLLLLPAVDDWANVWAGIAGGLIGAACGMAAALGRR